MAGELQHQFVVFALHGEQYALPVTAVQEITRYVAPTATAAATGLVRGLINLRGRVLPVADLSPRLGHTLEVSTGTRILVVEVSGGTLGLIVDRVAGVVEVRAEQVETLPVAVEEDALSERIAVVGDSLVMLLDPERALGGILPKRPARRRSTAKASSPAPKSPAKATSSAKAASPANAASTAKPASSGPAAPRKRPARKSAG